MKGILQGLDPSTLMVFSVDNIDFIKSYVQVYCGNQQLAGMAPLYKQFKPNHPIRKPFNCLILPQEGNIRQ